MKHKKLLIVALVVVVMAVAASVAYAWWTTTASLEDNTIQTGTLGVEIGNRAGGAINVTGLKPMAAPALEAPGQIPALNNQDPDAEQAYPQAFFWVHNTSDIEAMFYAWLNVTAETRDIRDKIMCRIWLGPEDWTPVDDANWWKPGETYMVYQGPLSGIDSPADGKANLSSRKPNGDLDPIPAGKWGVYKVVFWLDGPTSGPETMGVTLTLDLDVAAGQVEAWPNF